MQNVDELLQKNSVRVGILLRKHRITGAVDMDTIKKAFERKGENFMIELMQILVPDQSNFETLIQPKSAILAAPKLETKNLMPMNSTTTQPQGGFWSFWDKLLNTVATTGEAIQQFKTDVQTAPASAYETAAQEKQAASHTKTLYLVAAGIVALIVIILIIRK